MAAVEEKDSPKIASEDALVARACAGCAVALEELLARLEVPLRQSLTNLIPAAYRSAFDADDIIQVTFIEAFLRIGGFSPRGTGSCLAWLTRLGRNNLTDAIRELRREKRVPREKLVSVGGRSDSYEGFLAALGGSSSTPSRGAVRIEVKSLIEEAMVKLPPDYERVVRLMDLEGKTAPQAAAEMGRSKGAVYMLQARARAHLREILGPSGNFFSSGS
jgi:RNA polymerase sigma-70 factor, ECF subfamily